MRQWHAGNTLVKWRTIVNVLRTHTKRMHNDSLTKWTISYRLYNDMWTICERFTQTLLKRWTEEKVLSMFKNLFSAQRVSAFADNRVTLITHA